MQAAKLTEVHVPGTTLMSAAAVDLDSAGYTKREFYAEGTASRYSAAVSTSLQTAQVIDGNWPYRTRVITRTADARKFNGTLVMEWANVAWSASLCSTRPTSTSCGKASHERSSQPSGQE